MKKAQRKGVRRISKIVEAISDGVPARSLKDELLRLEGKRYNQAIRALGRHLCRVIFKMLRQERPYMIDP